MSTQPSDNLDHYFCCDPAAALCGREVLDLEAAGASDPAEMCVVCIGLARTRARRSCGAPFCRLRRRWRRFRGRRSW
jgi:hypothetical protein